MSVTLATLSTPALPPHPATVTWGVDVWVGEVEVTTLGHELCSASWAGKAQTSASESRLQAAQGSEPPCPWPCPCSAHQVHFGRDGGVQQVAAVPRQRRVCRRAGEGSVRSGLWSRRARQQQPPAPSASAAMLCNGRRGPACQPHPPVTVHCRPRACTSLARRKPAATSYMRMRLSCWYAAAWQGGAK